MDERASVPMTLQFLGAAGTVTGSRFLLRTAQGRVLVDCGLFQGEREWRRRNWASWPFDVDSLDAVVVTHAHLDHCGALPLLARLGFGGRVVCTPDTARLAAIVLRDAAHLQEEEAELANRYGYSRHHPALPLYDAADAEKAIGLLDPVAHDVETALAPAVHVRLRRAGHILGSAFVEVDAAGRRVTFSGDLGRPGHPLLQPPEAPHPADTFVVESTYGDLSHDPPEDDRLADIIRRTARRGGVTLLPAFAVDRTAVLLRTLSELEDRGDIPSLPVFVDSPMALRALDVYRDAFATGAPDVRPGLTDRSTPAQPEDLHLVGSREGSERLNRPRQPCIVISASGMASGGRVLHHLADQLPEPRNSVVLTGFQVPGTRGRALADGVRQIKIHGRYVPVLAEVSVLLGYSAHADSDQMVGWLSGVPAPRCGYVVHGEPLASQRLAERLRTELGWTVAVPRYLETVRVD
jgi:metallo-beta-lactamase family protein